MTSSDRKPRVDAAISEISHIATLPEITLKIIELVESPTSTAQDLHNVISQDPALCSRILKVVNSSFYGLPGQIGSINRAIVMLGLNAVKNIAIAASLVKLFRGGDLTSAFSAKLLWEHCSRVAACAKLINDRLRLGLGDEAYLAGLIHDLGIVVEMQYDRNTLIEVIERTAPDSEGVPANDMLEIELQAFGATHQDFGAGLCERWKFPASFAQVTGFHHNPLDLPDESRLLTSVIYIADRIAADAPDGFRLDLVNTNIDTNVLDAIKITTSQLDAIREEFEQQEPEAFDLAA